MIITSVVNAFDSIRYSVFLYNLVILVQHVSFLITCGSGESPNSIKSSIAIPSAFRGDLSWGLPIGDGFGVDLGVTLGVALGVVELLLFFN